MYPKTDFFTASEHTLFQLKLDCDQLYDNVNILFRIHPDCHSADFSVVFAIYEIFYHGFRDIALFKERFHPVGIIKGDPEGIFNQAEPENGVFFLHQPLNYSL